MYHLNGLSLALFLAVAQPALGAGRDADVPDKEMLKMMEFLRDMEMIKQMEMMRELDRAELAGDAAKSSTPTRSATARKKEAPK